MAAKLSPEIATGRRREADMPLAAALERLAFLLNRGLISPHTHAIEKAKLLASNTP
jgi:hypothetical protein